MTKTSLQLHLNDTKVLKGGALLFAIFYSLSEYLWGIIVPDSFFWISSAQSWTNDPLDFLSLWLMNAWHQLTGYTLLSNRLLAFIATTSTILSAFLLIPKRKRNDSIYYFCGAFIILGPAMQKCCTPDSFSSLFLMVLMTVTLSLDFKRPQYIGIIIISVLTSVLIAIRFPNVTCMPLVMAWLLFQRRSWKMAIINILLYTTFSFFFYKLLIYFFFNTWNVVDLITNAIQNVSHESNGNHSLTNMLKGYIISTLLTISTVSVLVVTYYNTHFMRNKKYLSHIIVFIIGGGVFLCSYSDYLFHHCLKLPWHSFYLSIAGYVAALLLYLAFINKKMRTKLIFLTGMLFVPSAGSDTIFFKSLIIACSLLPVCFSLLPITPFKKYCLHLLVVAALAAFATSNYQILYNTVSAKSGPLRYIHLEPEQLRNYQEADHSVLPYFIKDNTVFYGTETHYLYFSTNTKKLYDTHFWMNRNDTMAIHRAINAIKDNAHSVLIDISLSDTTIFTNNGLTLKAKEPSFNVYAQY